MGSLSCLSVSEGDIQITFDNTDAAEAIRAKRMITDMLKRGYALLVKQEDGSWTRCLEFDEKNGNYIVADFDPVRAEKIDQEEANAKETESPETAQQETGKAKRGRPKNEVIAPGERRLPGTPGPRKGRGRKTVTMSKSHATAVAPSSGG